MRVLGIDPGMSGGMAIFCANATVPTPPDGIIDMPTTGEKPHRRVWARAARDWIYKMQPTHVALELVWAMPPKKSSDPNATGGGATSNFSFGGAFHAIWAVLDCLDIEPHFVVPITWKKLYPELKRQHENQDMKEAARQLALRDHAAIEPFLKRKKDHNRAEAWLIARWYAEQLMKAENSSERPARKKRGSTGGGQGGLAF